MAVKTSESDVVGGKGGIQLCMCHRQTPSMLLVCGGGVGESSNVRVKAKSMGGHVAERYRWG